MWWNRPFSQRNKATKRCGVIIYSAKETRQQKVWEWVGQNLKKEGVGNIRGGSSENGGCQEPSVNYDEEHQYFQDGTFIMFVFMLESFKYNFRFPMCLGSSSGPFLKAEFFA